MSYNPIDKLTGIDKLKSLKVLFMGNCKVASEKEFAKLQDAPCLEELVFFGNPLHRTLAEKEGELAYYKFVLDMLPNLRKLDGVLTAEIQQKLSGGNKVELKEVYALNRTLTLTLIGRSN